MLEGNFEITICDFKSTRSQAKLGNEKSCDTGSDISVAKLELGPYRRPQAGAWGREELA
jgi:hypothetical protein